MSAHRSAIVGMNREGIGSDAIGLKHVFNQVILVSDYILFGLIKRKKNLSNRFFALRPWQMSQMLNLRAMA
jgi:hypothetical protein